jgi:hypothetical protein
MTTTTADDPLTRSTDDRLVREIPTPLQAARRDVLAAVRDLRSIPDPALTRPWAWKGGSEEELRYGFYRIAESFERASIDADATMRAAGVVPDRSTELIRPATAARWDLQGVLDGLPDATWDADPGNAEWTVRQTLGHVIASQRGYAVFTAWWIEQALPVDSADLPSAPESLDSLLPSEDEEAEGAPLEVRQRLDGVLDHAAERLAYLPPEQLAYAARWSGFPVDVGFRQSRWASHLREHTIQVEKTLAMLGQEPNEVQRLVRLVLAAWGRAESIVFGSVGVAESVGILAAAAAGASETAAEIAALARD